MERAKRAKYTLEFKQEAVRLVETGQTLAAAARSLGLVEQTLHNWVKAERQGKLKGAEKNAVSHWWRAAHVGQSANRAPQHTLASTHATGQTRRTRRIEGNETPNEEIILGRCVERYSFDGCGVRINLL